jgi:hypothetical protein
MRTIQNEKSSLQKSLIEENQQKENVLNMLEYTESKKIKFFIKYFYWSKINKFLNHQKHFIKSVSCY